MWDAERRGSARYRPVIPAGRARADRTAFPQDPYEQLELAIKAVFNSWMGRRAVDYRREFKITPDMANGTAVNVQ
jgi:phosphoenolpyruvate synthase/pyruvate phosphate dikinase